MRLNGVEVFPTRGPTAPGRVELKLVGRRLGSARGLRPARPQLQPKLLPAPNRSMWRSAARSAGTSCFAGQLEPTLHDYQTPEFPGGGEGRRRKSDLLFRAGSTTRAANAKQSNVTLQTSRGEAVSNRHSVVATGFQPRAGRHTSVRDSAVRGNTPHGLKNPVPTTSGHRGALAVFGHRPFFLTVLCAPGAGAEHIDLSTVPRRDKRSSSRFTTVKI